MYTAAGPGNTSCSNVNTEYTPLGAVLWSRGCDLMTHPSNDNSDMTSHHDMTRLAHNHGVALSGMWGEGRD